MASLDRTHCDWRSLAPEMFDLIRAAVLPTDAALESWRRWIARHELDTLPEGAFPLLPAVSANLPDGAVGPDAERLRGIRRRNWTEAELRLSAVDGVLEALDSVGVEALLSGALARLSDDKLAPGTVPLPVSEILVAPSSFDEAARVLTSRGWVSGHEPSWTHVRRFERSDERVWLYRWYLFPMCTERPDDDARLRADRIDWRGRVVRRRTPADEFVATVAATHAPIATSRRLLDAVALVQHAGEADDLFWDHLRSYVHTDLASVVADALVVCRSEFGLAVPDGLTEELIGVPSGRRPRRSGELGRVERYRRVSRALGRRPSPTEYTLERWSTLRRVGVFRAVTSRTHGALSRAHRARRDR